MAIKYDFILNGSLSIYVIVLHSISRQFIISNMEKTASAVSDELPWILIILNYLNWF